jgi:hypothetical protein
MMTIVVVDNSSSSIQAAGCSSCSCRAAETGTKSVLVVIEAATETVNAAGMFAITLNLSHCC